LYAYTESEKKNTYMRRVDPGCVEMPSWVTSLDSCLHENKLYKKRLNPGSWLALPSLHGLWKWVDSTCRVDPGKLFSCKKHDLKLTGFSIEAELSTTQHFNPTRVNPPHIILARITKFEELRFLKI